MYAQKNKLKDYLVQSMVLPARPHFFQKVITYVMRLVYILHLPSAYVFTCSSLLFVLFLDPELDFRNEANIY
jgi:hypothetical protein